MVLQEDGPISLEDVQNEFGGDDPINFNEYYPNAYTGYSGHENDLLLWLKFDSSIVQDYSSHNHSISKFTGTTPTLESVDNRKGDSHLKITANTGYVINQSTKYVIPDGTAELSVCFWMRNQGSDDRLFRYRPSLIVFGNYANTNCGFDMTNITNIWTSPLFHTEWKHYVFTVIVANGDSSTKVYIDGIDNTNSWSKGTNAGIPTGFTNSGAESSGTKFGLFFNHYYYAGDYTQYFQGDVDDFRIYNKALSQTEINQVIGYTTPLLHSYSGYVGHENDLLGWYKFDGNLNDSSGNNQHISSSITTSTADFVKGSSSLYSTSKSATGNVGTIDLSNRSFTITVWMKLNSLDSYFFTQGTTYSYHQRLHIGIRTSGVYTLAFYGNDLNSTGSYTSDLNKWIHLAFIVEKNSSGLSDRYIYRNGILIGSNFNKANFTGGGTLIINGYSTGRGFTGYMDDFRVYNRTLSQTEVQHVMKNSQFLMEENTTPIDLSTFYNTGMKFNISPDIITQQKSGLDLKSFYVFNYNASYNTSGYTEYTVILSSMTSCEILMVGGGGSGGRSQTANRGGGGGGAGGLIYISKINLTPGEYTIRVGNGGSGSSSGVNGINTTISGPISYTAYGGGGGGNTGTSSSSTSGDTGGSGGGGADYNGYGGNSTQTGLYSHGNPGGKAVQGSGWTAGGSGAGGGGSQSKGNDANRYTIGTGGNGKSYSITGISIEYAKGGDGGRYNAGTGANGTNGRGNGGNGAGRYGTQKGGNGGSGVVVIKLLGRDYASTFEYPPMALTSNNSNGYICTKSSINSTSWDAWKAFNKVIANEGYHSSGNTYRSSDGAYISNKYLTDTSNTNHSGEWLQLKLPVAKQMVYCTLAPRTGYNYRCARSGVIMGSNTGVNGSWVLLTEFSNKSYSDGVETEIMIDSNQAYLYYVLLCKTLSTHSNATTLNISEVKYFAHH